MKAKVGWILACWICLVSIVAEAKRKRRGHEDDGPSLWEDLETHSGILKKEEEEERRDFILVKDAEVEANEYLIEFRVKGPVGIQFDGSVAVMAFTTLDGGKRGPAQKSGAIQIGDVLVEVNGDSLEGLTTADAYQVLEEAALLSAEEGKPRRFKFKRAATDDNVHDLSEEAKFLAKDGHIEHIDIYPLHEEEVSVHTMLAEGFGAIPQSCKKRRLVILENTEGCEEDLQNLPEDLDNAFVLVRRGGCSFHGKAFNLQRYNASGVIVMNTEDSLFRMKIESYKENEVRIPVTLISSIDGERLIAMQDKQMHDYFRGLSVRLIASEKCFEMEKREVEAEAKKTNPDKTSVQSIALEEGDVIHDSHRLFGALSPSGVVRVLASQNAEGMQKPHQDAFEFLTTSFSGILPVGKEMVIVQSLQTPEQSMAYVFSGWEGLGMEELFRELLRMQKHYSKLDCVLLVSSDTLIWKLEGPNLPTQLRLAVVMVSRKAAKQILELDQAKIVLEPNHRIMHRWNQLATLSSTPIPSNPQQKRKFFSRLSKVGADTHLAATTCWEEHFRTIRDGFTI